jgi:hypothetical protein
VTGTGCEIDEREGPCKYRNWDRNPSDLFHFLVRLYLITYVSNNNDIEVYLVLHVPSMSTQYPTPVH